MNRNVWCLGRLQTDADRARVLDGLEGAEPSSREELDQTMKRLAPRWFVVRDGVAGGYLHSLDRYQCSPHALCS